VRVIDFLEVVKIEQCDGANREYESVRGTICLPSQIAVAILARSAAMQEAMISQTVDRYVVCTSRYVCTPSTAS
jgi:hypothetical protein